MLRAMYAGESVDLRSRPLSLATTVEQINITLVRALVFEDGFESGDTTAWSEF